MSRITPTAPNPSARMYFRFTDCHSACLHSLRPLCIVARVCRANSPKGGDAKPPVYGHECLRQRGCRHERRDDSPTQLNAYRRRRSHRHSFAVLHTRSCGCTCPGFAVFPGGSGGHARDFRRHPFFLDERRNVSNTSSCTGPSRSNATYPRVSHVQFNFALLYSGLQTHAGRALSGVPS